MLKFFAALLLCVASCAPAHADGIWEKSSTRGPSPVAPIVVEVDVMPDVCLQNRTPFVKAAPAPRGCYFPWTRDAVFPFFVNPGWILLAKRMPPWERECVLRHEEDHDGYKTGVAKDHRHGDSDC